MKRITFEVDDLDFEAIQKAVARRQAAFRVNGELIIPDGEGDLRGRLIAEICRGWVEFLDKSAAKGG